MSVLDKLLHGVEVEWKTLGELVKLVKGKQLNKELLSVDGLYPAYNGGTSFSGFTDVYNYNENTTIISQGGASAGFVNFVKTKFFANAHCYVILPKIEIVENRYIYHFLKLSQESLMTKKHGAGIPALSTNEILEIPIPIPCPDNSKKSLSIQKEIARILDTFTELTTELTAELTARKKQYSYYREQLLSFEDGEVEWKSLGEVVLSTSNIRWKDTLKSFRYIDLTSVCRDKNVIIETIEINKDNAPSRAQKLLLKNDVIFATTRPTQQRLCLITEDYSGEVASTGYCVLRANTNVILPKWIYFWITSNQFKNYVEENQSGSAYPAISDAKVKEFQIPIPSLEEQERIVSILDKFDILTTSISEGLPKEIELRKKQYEYYRDLLLTFPKNNIES
jgi:type I restriction enzyme S subunit